MTDQTTNSDIDEAFIAALAERVAETVYRRLRGDILMLDDMLVSEEELAAIFHRHPEAVKTWRKVGVGPQGVRPAGARKLLYRIGAIKHYLTEIRAGAMHLTPFLEAQREVEKKWGGREAAG